MGLRVVSYNILADSYVEPSYFPRTPAEILDAGRRRPALAARIAGLGADVVCLQEVEPDALAIVRAALPAHQACFEPKRGKPDGVATLVRGVVRHRASVVYPDGTGHVALLLAVEHEGRLLGVANTHLKWGPPPGAPVSVAQAEALLDAIDRFEPACAGWVVCGDFNARPESVPIERMRARGLRDGYAAYRAHDAFTANANAEAKRIDFVLHAPSLTAVPLPLPAITAETPLPSAAEPSDHLPIGADLTWAPL